MEELNEERICQLVSTALERIAFVFAEQLELSDESPSDRHAEIHFSSPETSGHLVLSATTGFLEEVAANLLGVEVEEVTEEEGVQALTELANIIGGEVVLALGASSIPFELGLPREIDAAPPASEEARSACVESDGGLLEVRLQYQ